MTEKYKRILVYSLSAFVLPVLSLLIVSCSDDEEDNIPTVVPSATGTLTDSDGNEYKWVRIGKLDWMAESFRGGDYWVGQRYVTQNGLSSTLSATDVEEAEKRFKELGNYYTWQQAVDLCPEGWRLPTDDDWKQLEMALGMSKSEADKTGWRTGAGALLTQGSEGTGLNFGYAGQLSSFSTAYFSEYHVGDYGYFWSSTPDPDLADPCVFIRKITPAQPNMVQRISALKNYRYLSVRYCRDAK